MELGDDPADASPSSLSRSRRCTVKMSRRGFEMLREVRSLLSKSASISHFGCLTRDCCSVQPLPRRR
jgi:hypothetical protein